MDGSREDRSEIQAGDSTIFWQGGSAETWLISGSSWEEQGVQGSRQSRHKAGMFNGSDGFVQQIRQGAVQHPR